MNLFIISIQMPDQNNLTANCKDFLYRLLQHDPKSRMNYEEFFKHPFLDLEHVPSEANFKKALKILNEAEYLDKSGKKTDAINKYCEGLRYLVPILNGKLTLLLIVLLLDSG